MRLPFLSQRPREFTVEPVHPEDVDALAALHADSHARLTRRSSRCEFGKTPHAA